MNIRVRNNSLVERMFQTCGLYDKVCLVKLKSGESGQHGRFAAHGHAWQFGLYKQDHLCQPVSCCWLRLWMLKSYLVLGGIPVRNGMMCIFDSIWGDPGLWVTKIWKHLSVGCGVKKERSCNGQILQWLLSVLITSPRAQLCAKSY